MRTFVIYTNPIPKARPRFNTKTKKTYTQTRYQVFHDEIQHAVRSAIGKYFDYPMYEPDVPIWVDLDFVFARRAVPKNQSNRKCMVWRAKRPDKDNLEKAIFDALNEWLWADDKQIIGGTTRKFDSPNYGKPKICIKVQKAPHPELITKQTYNLVYPIEAVSKERPRFTTVKHRPYTSPKTRTFQNAIRKATCLHLGKECPYPLFESYKSTIVDLDFIYERPMKYCTKRYDTEFLWKPTKPDKDNLEKAMLDALNGILWYDDAQVVAGTTRKMYGPPGQSSYIGLNFRAADKPPAVTCEYNCAEFLLDLPRLY